MHITPGVLQHGNAGVGQRLDTALEWSDLGASPGLHGELTALRDHVVLHRRRADPILFVGPPGHGQALVAALLGKAAGLPVHRVDLSTVVSRYIGETEKNLSRVLLRAERSDSILFFDEADALFGKRSEIHDAHDRYANTEVNSVLQRMEAHDGLLIIASRSRANIDPAFLRRLRYVLTFQTPLHPPRGPLGR
jgi:SpoVK/Ycf46/Vps4 family AAA+-type ATPase